MSEMSAIVAGEESCPLKGADSGHLFRSKVIDKFARVELSIARALSKTPNASKSEGMPLGQRIETLRRMAKDGSTLFGEPKRLADLLDRLRPFCDIRNAVVHATLETVATSKGELLLFRTIPCTDESEFHALVLNEAERKLVWDRLCALTNQICMHLDGKTASASPKAAPNPPAPPCPAPPLHPASDI